MEWVFWRASVRTSACGNGSRSENIDGCNDALQMNAFVIQLANQGSHNSNPKYFESLTITRKKKKTLSSNMLVLLYEIKSCLEWCLRISIAHVGLWIFVEWIFCTSLSKTSCVFFWEKKQNELCSEVFPRTNSKNASKTNACPDLNTPTFARFRVFVCKECWANWFKKWLIFGHLRLEKSRTKKQKQWRIGGNYFTYKWTLKQH